MGQRHRRHRPAHVGCAGRRDPRAAPAAEALAFFDAIAPVIHLHSIDETKAWRQSRYDKPGPGGTGADYINCAMDKPQYEAFIDALLAGEKTSFKEWEATTPYFDGCLPVEVMAERGRDTLRFGPMKPVGLSNPHEDGRRPYAVVQLRQDNALGTLWNMVGFQTKLKHAEQVRVLRMIPGLENAEFARLGGLHRNTFLDSPRLLDPLLRLQGRAAAALRRPDHRRRRLCRERRDRAARGPLRRRRTPGTRRRDAPADDRARRADRAHHGGALRGVRPSGSDTRTRRADGAGAGDSAKPPKVARSSR